jgi:hypothetical protein
MRKTILHLCADTGSDSQPYRDAGYEVILVGSDIGVENFRPSGNVQGIIANPVCTGFSRARTGGKASDVVDGMYLVDECMRVIRQANPVWWVMENPATGALKELIGAPRFVYEPWWFGSPWTKRTALWGNFNQPQRLYERWEDVLKIPELPIYQGRQKPSIAKLHYPHKRFIREFDPFTVRSDMEFRSLCSQKFAKAFFEANP